MKNVHSFALTRLARLSLLAVPLAGCALAATACSSPSAAPSAQTTPNRGSANTVATSSSPTSIARSANEVASPSAPASATSQPPAAQGTQTAQYTNPPAPPPGPLTAKLVGLPASIAMGSAPVQFQAVINNSTATDYPSVAPVFQIVGGPANHVNATLQEYDPVSRTWHNTPMPEGDGANPLTFAARGTHLAPGQGLTITYRLTVSTQNPAEPTAAILYAATLPGDTALATTTIRGRITTS